MEQKIVIPQDLRNDVEHRAYALKGLIEAGHAPDYPAFVEALFKKLDSTEATLHHATTGMAGEGGELLDASKKAWIYGKELDVKNLIEELGDMRFYYQAALNLLGLTDDDIKADNVRKLQKRYPGGVYRDSDAIARADKAEGATGTLADVSVQQIAVANGCIADDGVVDHG